MKIHIYTMDNTKKIAQLNEDVFSSISFVEDLDNFSSCNLQYNLNSPMQDIVFFGMENLYIEDDGEIIFGGTIQSQTATESSVTLECIDHRWLLNLLILDQKIIFNRNDNILLECESLLNIAKQKRFIPLVFDVENSAINSNQRTDLIFDIGEGIGSCMQKIIQTVFARWAVDYNFVGNEIIGKLRIRSISNVFPEGVGISRTKTKSEDGQLIILKYKEGSNQSNIQNFRIKQGFDEYITRPKVGYKANNQSTFFTMSDAQVGPVFNFYESFFGRSEKLITDYNANSPQTAFDIARINQVAGVAEIDITLSPTFNEKIKCGDRVQLYIDSPLVKANDNYGGVTLLDIPCRIDSMVYTRMNGYWQKNIKSNLFAPQKNSGATGIIKEIGDIKENLNSLNQNYFNNPNT